VNRMYTHRFIHSHIHIFTHCKSQDNIHVATVKVIIGVQSDISYIYTCTYTHTPIHYPAHIRIQYTRNLREHNNAGAAVNTHTHIHHTAHTHVNTHTRIQHTHTTCERYTITSAQPSTHTYVYSTQHTYACNAHTHSL